MTHFTRLDRTTSNIFSVPRLRRELRFKFALPRHGVLTANSHVNGPMASLHALTLNRCCMQLLKFAWSRSSEPRRFLIQLT